ncbi:TIGR01777 family oxidoreductase [uncultured Abyssibacter sp.]|uniref:TIGR01777 family oxidoreductase n=1 Tax=uncultured Abyssibacter sp. TaxID=2320202 RepID=UPI0032B0F57D
MHALITGGTGFIGQALIPELIAAGWRLTVLTRDPIAAHRRLPAAVRCVATLDAAPQAVDAVVNLAGESLAAGRWNARRKQMFHDSRVGLTETLVQWMGQQPEPPAVLVSASAVGFYGAQGNTLLDETAAPVNEYQHRLCDAWEAAARQAEALGTRVVRLRIGVVLDADGGALQAMLPPFRFGLGGWLGEGHQWMSWIHRKDLIALIQLALSDPQLSGAVNAVAPTPVTNRHFSRALGHALHRPVFLPIPAWALRLLVGEMAHLLLTGQRVVPVAATEAGFDYEFDTVEAAFADIFD